jgi:flagellin-like protein
MFEFITDSEERGQVGIGTLIVFIALVLVAAVAAGVLINTAGELQSRASDTGDDAQAQVSNQIDVVSATGVDDDSDTDPNDDDIEKLRLVVKKSPGSDPIDLSAATIKYTSGSESVTLLAGTSNASLNSIKSSGGTTAVLEDTTERVRITIDLANAASDLPEGGSAELKIVDQSGATTTYGVNVPEVVDGTYVEV